MKLYYAKGACSFSVRILLHELNIPCIYEAVDLKTKLTEKGADYSQINPKGSVPALELDSGEVLTEGVIILQYLAEQHQPNSLLPSKEHFEHYRVLELANFLATDLHKGMGVMFNPAITEEMKNNIFLPFTYKKLDYVNQLLTNRDYLAGQHFTIVDPYLYVILTWTPHFKINLAQYPHISSYFKKLSQRPSILKSHQEEAQN